jgi:serine/threonine protein kinase
MSEKLHPGMVAQLHRLREEQERRNSQRGLEGKLVEPSPQEVSAILGLPVDGILDLGMFDQTKIIGEGSFSTVYKATGPKEGDVAIKEFRLAVGEGETFDRKRELFQREARLYQDLGEHPQIPTLFGVGAHRSDRGSLKLYHPGLVMQYVDGLSLAQRIERGEQFSPEEIRNILLQALNPLEAIHHGNSVPRYHRDIKPENLKLSSDGKLHVLDFGSVRDEILATLGGTIGVGSLAEAHPEQFSGNPSFRTELYALGRTLYQTVIGRRLKPREKFSAEKLMQTNLDPQMKEVIALLCDPELSHGPQDVRELRTYLDGESPLEIVSSEKVIDRAEGLRKEIASLQQDKLGLYGIESTVSTMLLGGMGMVLTPVIEASIGTGLSAEESMIYGTLIGVGIGLATGPIHALRNRIRRKNLESKVDRIEAGEVEDKDKITKWEAYKFTSDLGITIALGALGYDWLTPETVSPDWYTGLVMPFAIFSPVTRIISTLALRQERLESAVKHTKPLGQKVRELVARYSSLMTFDTKYEILARLALTDDTSQMEIVYKGAWSLNKEVRKLAKDMVEEYDRTTGFSGTILNETRQRCIGSSIDETYFTMRERKRLEYLEERCVTNNTDGLTPDVLFRLVMYEHRAHRIGVLLNEMLLSLEEHGDFRDTRAYKGLFDKSQLGSFGRSGEDKRLPVISKNIVQKKIHFYKGDKQ